MSNLFLYSFLIPQVKGCSQLTWLFHTYLDCRAYSLHIQLRMFGSHGASFEINHVLGLNKTCKIRYELSNEQSKTHFLWFNSALTLVKQWTGNQQGIHWASWYKLNVKLTVIQCEHIPSKPSRPCTREFYAGYTDLGSAVPDEPSWDIPCIY